MNFFKFMILTSFSIYHVHNGIMNCMSSFDTMGISILNKDANGITHYDAIHLHYPH